MSKRIRLAFSFSTAGGLIFAKIMNLFLKTKINPLLGSAGVSAVPMAARVSHKMGNEANPKCYLLMHAMGPNVAGVIGTVIVAGILITLVKEQPPEVPPADPEALAGAIHRLLTDRELQARCQMSGPRRVAAHFCLERQVAATEQVYALVRAGAPLPAELKVDEVMSARAKG